MAAALHLSEPGSGAYKAYSGESDQSTLLISLYIACDVSVVDVHVPYPASFCAAYLTTYGDTIG